MRFTLRDDVTASRPAEEKNDKSTTVKNTCIEVVDDGSPGKITKIMKDHKSIVAIVIAGAIAIVLAVSLFAGYQAIAAEYNDKFLPGTVIQSVDVSELTLDEAVDEVSHQLSDAKVSIVETGHDTVEITGADIGLSPIPDEMERILSEQNKGEWLPREIMSQKNEVESHPVGLQYDTDAVNQIAEKIECADAGKRTAPEDAKVVFDDDKQSYIVEEGAPGDLVDKDLLLSAISKTAANGGGEIHVDELYAKPSISSDDERLQSACAEMNRILDKKITYNIDMIDDAETIPREKLVKFLTLDKDLSPTVKEKPVRKWLREIGVKYDTAGSTRTYTTAYGKEATLPGGSYGWITDEDAMLPVIIEDILSADDTVDKDFLYQQEAAGTKDGDEWGDRYVDLDLTDQKVRLVEDGKVVAEYETVTGSDNDRMRTPTGAWQIYFMQRDFTMVGDDYNGDGKSDYSITVPVFAGFVSGCGFHPSADRSNWSPTAWRNGAGSHGCANMHPADAEAVYEFVEMGTPVLVHM